MKGESGKRYDGRKTKVFKRMAKVAIMIRWQQATLADMAAARQEPLTLVKHRCKGCNYYWTADEYCKACKAWP